MLMTGTPIDARTAAEWGWSTTSSPPPGCATRLWPWPNGSSKRVLVVGIGKQAYAQIDLDQDKAYDYAKEVMSLNMMADDAQEGIGGALEKRNPCWSGR